MATLVQEGRKDGRVKCELADSRPTAAAFPVDGERTAGSHMNRPAAENLYATTFRQTTVMIAISTIKTAIWQQCSRLHPLLKIMDSHD